MGKSQHAVCTEYFWYEQIVLFVRSSEILQNGGIKKHLTQLVTAKNHYVFQRES